MKKYCFYRIMVVLLLAIALTGCGGGGKKNSPPSSPPKIYAGVYDSMNGVGTLLKSTDGGNTVTELSGFTANLENANISINGIFVSNNAIYVTTSKGLAISPDNGASFSWFDQAEQFSLIYVSETTIYAAIVDSKRLAISYDNGNNWTYKLEGYEINSIHGSESMICVATRGNGLAVSTNNGASFTFYNHSAESTSLADDSVNGVRVSNGVIYAATANGLSISNDSGITFTTKLSGEQLSDIALSGSYVYAAADSDLWISNNGGDSFIDKPMYDDIWYLQASGNTVYVRLFMSSLVSYDNGGSFSSVSGLDGRYVTSLFVR